MSRALRDTERDKAQITGDAYSQDLMIRVIDAAQCFLDDMERQV